MTVPTRYTVYQPTCRTVFSEGGTRSFSGVAAAGAFGAGGSYGYSTGSGSFVLRGHIAPKRTLVIDTYQREYRYSVGSFAGHSDESVSIGPGEARF